MGKNFEAPVTVSDHALVRYMERVMNLDLDSIRQQILTPERVSAIKAGAVEIIGGDCTLRCKNRTVITIVKEKG